MRTLLRLSLALCLFCPFCHAGNITLYKIGNDELLTSPSINAAGVVEGERIHCSVSGSDCYAEFTDGQPTYVAGVPPAGFVADNGSPCASIVAGGGPAFCNDGFEVYALNRQIWEVLPGGDPLGVYVGSGTADIVSLNSAGDFVWVDAAGNSTFQVMLSTTPEPSSFALLATGLVGAAGLLRKRLA